MRSGLFEAIAKYLDRIHKTLIWPTLKEKPDTMARFHRILMETHSNAEALFLRRPKPCTDDDQCEQDEECKGGFCVPIPTSMRSTAGKPCTDDDQCEQDEECIAGFCTPIGLAVDWSPLDEKVSYGQDMEAALKIYYGRIYTVIATGLGKKPAKLPGVRELLMLEYARAAKIAGRAKLCTADRDCEQDHVCVEGVCVPIPFRLRFRPLETTPAWILGGGGDGGGDTSA